jgi:hypothetical protein
LEKIGRDRTAARHVVLSPKLIARESTGPPGSQPTEQSP